MYKLFHHCIVIIFLLNRSPTILLTPINSSETFWEELSLSPQAGCRSRQSWLMEWRHEQRDGIWDLKSTLSVLIDFWMNDVSNTSPCWNRQSSFSFHWMCFLAALLANWDGPALASSSQWFVVLLSGISQRFGVGFWRLSARSASNRLLLVVVSANTLSD